MVNFVWNELIDFALYTQQNYFNFNSNQLNWLKLELYIIYQCDYDLNTKYKCLVLLNRSIKHGRYALIFNKEIQEAVFTENSDLLREIFLNPPLVELDCLPIEEKNKWLLEINNHIIALNLYIDKKILSQHELFVLNNISITHNIDNYLQCYTEVCLINSNTDFVCISPDVTQFSDYDKKYPEKYIMMEIDLIFLLLSKGPNPYTNTYMSKEVVNKLNENYSDIIKICKHAFKLGYRHNYKI